MAKPETIETKNVTDMLLLQQIDLLGQIRDLLVTLTSPVMRVENTLILSQREKWDGSFGLGEWKMRNGRKAVITTIGQKARRQMAGYFYYEEGTQSSNTNWDRDTGLWSPPDTESWDLITPWTAEDEEAMRYSVDKEIPF